MSEKLSFFDPKIRDFEGFHELKKSRFFGVEEMLCISEFQNIKYFGGL